MFKEYIISIARMMMVTIFFALGVLVIGFIACTPAMWIALAIIFGLKHI